MYHQTTYARRTRPLIALGLICFLLGLAQDGKATLLPFTSYTVNGSGELTGFTVSSGTYTDVISAESATGDYYTYAPQTPPGDVAETGGAFLNFWEAGTTETQGYASMVNLQPNNGGLNVGDSDGSGVNDTTLNNGYLEIYFGARLEGRSGAGNDIFLMDLNGDDAITVQAINNAGDVLGDQSVSITVPDWSGSTLTYQFYHELNANIQPPSEPYWTAEGVGFDVEDFFSGTPGVIEGIRLTGASGVDLTVAGFTGEAVIPEPSIALLLAGGCAFIWARRRRK